MMSFKPLTPGEVAALLTERGRPPSMPESQRNKGHR